MKQRYCAYCGRHSPDAGFKKMVNPKQPRYVRYMCANCQDIRKKLKEKRNEDSNHQ